MKIFIIYNPVSGIKLKFRDIGETVCKRLREKSIKYIWYETKVNDDYKGLNKSFDRIIIIGGDGTVSNAVNYIIRKKLDVPIAIIPMGSANIIALGLKIPLMPSNALKVCLNGSLEKIDVGVINGKRYFLIGCGIGFDASLMRDASRWMKRYMGILSYLIIGIKNIFRMRRLTYFLYIGNKKIKGKARNILCMNIGKIEFFKLLPERDFTNGVLDVFIIHTKSLIDIIRIAFRILAYMLMLTKKVLSRGENDYRFRCFRSKKIKIKLKKPCGYQIDGEYIGLIKEANIEIIPRALKVIMKKH